MNNTVDNFFSSRRLNPQNLFLINTDRNLILKRNYMYTIKIHNCNIFPLKDINTNLKLKTYFVYTSLQGSSKNDSNCEFLVEYKNDRLYIGPDSKIITHYDSDCNLINNKQLIIEFELLTLTGESVYFNRDISDLTVSINEN